MSNWVRTFENNGDYIESLDGVDWADAPLPYPWHHCQVQTRGWFGMTYIERCACGAARMHSRHSWLNKNETRNARKKQQREDRKPRVTVDCLTCGEPYEAAKGSFQADGLECTTCWGKRLVRQAGA